MSLEVVELWGRGTLQDGGRPGYRRFGVPAGGAFDRASWRLGNALLGNAPHAAALELTLGKAVFRAQTATAVSIVGAPAHVALDGQALPDEACFDVNPGQLISIDVPQFGSRVWLGVRGGWIGQTVLGSVSGQNVSKGTTLVAGASEAHRPILKHLADPPPSRSRGPLRLIPGPQAAMFDLEGFQASGFRVTPQLDRVGIRLNGPALGDAPEIVSEPSCWGTVQVARDGQPILLGPDGPTIGGYPKVGVVATVDLDRLAHLCPEDEVTFLFIGLEEALDLAHQAEADLARLEHRLRLLS